MHVPLANLSGRVKGWASSEATGLRIQESGRLFVDFFQASSSICLLSLRVKMSNRQVLPETLT